MMVVEHPRKRSSTRTMQKSKTSSIRSRSKNRYNTEWYLTYFESNAETPRFPPNPDLALLYVAAAKKPSERLPAYAQTNPGEEEKFIEPSSLNKPRHYKGTS